MQQMQGLDSAFIAMEQPGAPVHIGSVLIYDPSTAPDGFVRFKDILRFIEGRLKLAPSMRRKMVKVPFGIDYPYWINDGKFDLEYHVRHIALPAPGDWRQLCILAARLFARPLDMTRPPWEITVVGGLDNVAGVPKGAYAMLTKMHHAAVDGASGVDLMFATHSFDAGVTPPDGPDKFKPDSEPSQIGMFMRGYTRSFTNPLRQANALRHALPGTFRAGRSFIKREFDFRALLEAPKTRFNGTVSPHRMFGGVTFPLEDIKSMRVMVENATVNDIMLSIVGGAMRRYLEAKNELPQTSVTAMAPISVRSEDEKNTMGNQVSAMFVPLGSHIGSPQARLEYVNLETKKAKTFTTALGARSMTEISKLSPAPAMNVGAALFSRLKLADYVKPAINTVVTNVPGPPVPLYSAGAKLVNMFGQLCLVDGMRLGHVVHSYIDKITVGFVSDRDAMPDPDFYSECLEQSFTAHLEAAKALKTPIKKSKPATKKPKAKRAAKATTTIRNTDTPKEGSKTKKPAKPASKASKTNGAGAPNDSTST